MAILSIPDEQRTIQDQYEIAGYLRSIGIDYERWEPSHPVASDASAKEILEAYGEEIERLKNEGGYVTADVIDVKPDTPGLDAMLAKFASEHWHSEDEVRFIIEGRGLFNVRPRSGPVVGIEVEPGDLIRVPKGTWHWFNLCNDRRIRAIRLFQDPAGWAANYTDSGMAARYQSVCFGASYIPIEAH
jgi:1,2-dihydroxy-3-keto-5-methylthiopentene dioxygenase